MRDELKFLTRPAVMRAVTVLSFAIYDVQRGDERLEEVVALVGGWADGQGLRTVITSETRQVPRGNQS